MLTSGDKILAWKSKGLSEKSIKLPDTPNNDATAKLAKIAVKTEESCLKQDNVPFNYRNIENLYIFHESHKWSYNQGADFTLGDSLFETMKPTKNGDSNKYGHIFENGHGIRFHERTRILLPWDGSSETIIFVVDNSSSAYVDNRKRDILIFAIRPQGIIQEGKKILRFAWIGK